MRTTNITIVLKALGDNDHTYVAIRPADATPAASAPGFLLQSHTLTSFIYELDNAASYWPECTNWQLIAADYASPEETQYAMTQVGPDMSTPAEAKTPAGPPSLRTLSHPVVLAAFNTEPD